jgi:hypothetical protein
MRLIWDLRFSQRWLWKYFQGGKKLANTAAVLATCFQIVFCFEAEIGYDIFLRNVSCFISELHGIISQKRRLAFGFVCFRNQNIADSIIHIIILWVEYVYSRCVYIYIYIYIYIYVCVCVYVYVCVCVF